MSDSEEIQEVRGNNAIPRCVGCGHEAWSDTYGAYACRSCTNFFINSIVHRETHTCKIILGLTHEGCTFCRLEKLYASGLKPIRYANNDGNTWFMKEKIPLLSKCTAYDYPLNVIVENPDLKGYVEMAETYVTGNMLTYLFLFGYYLRNNMITTNEETAIFDFAARGARMVGICKSIHAHDVLKTRFLEVCQERPPSETERDRYIIMGEIP
ncbi:nuclear receptor subfamily 2 group C member 1-A-like isoform X2 [Centruroides sculpturatus]|uniref:nuclear receptor subfamily 2 group C member 1-A-like isoform X2 n=1 Tax=Centruroides sculpturatus TaxID=218467 RepID=UPI000C6D9075|nr:nuclear receptor subfamily 2 group C member 1-A-like isoform X2 [Centruroides sculpturatus]